MDGKRKENFLKLIGSKGTITILRFLRKNNSAQYKHFMEFMNMCTLNKRVKQLLDFNLIEHHLEKKDTRKEWYNITERGEKILKIVEDMIGLAEG